MSYAGCYAMVYRGVDVAALLARMGLQAKVSEKVGTASLAYVAHKAASPRPSFRVRFVRVRFVVVQCFVYVLGAFRAF